MAQEWTDIESAPKDGRAIWARRVWAGSVIAEGWAFWGVNAADAPMRQGEDADHEYADTPRWLREGGQYSFPTPTEWLPDKER